MRRAVRTAKKISNMVTALLGIEILLRYGYLRAINIYITYHARVAEKIIR